MIQVEGTHLDDGIDNQNQSRSDPSPEPTNTVLLVDAFCSLQGTRLDLFCLHPI